MSQPLVTSDPKFADEVERGREGSCLHLDRVAGDDRQHFAVCSVDVSHGLVIQRP